MATPTYLKIIKSLLTIILGVSFLASQGQSHSDTIDFGPYDDITCKPGHSNSERAAAFEKIYHENHENQTFENQLLGYLYDQCMINYHYIPWFLIRNGDYTVIDDFPLAERVLITGLNRIEELKGDEDYPYARCTLLWDLTIFNYWHNQLEEAKRYACLVYQEEVMDCLGLLPALDKDEAEQFLEFYQEAIQGCK